jgi:glutaredoxin
MNKILIRAAVVVLIAAGVYRLMIVPLMEPVAASDISPGDDVVLFTTDWCRVCDRARDYLVANAVPFRELDIEKSADARSHYERLGGRGVPVALFGEHRVDGFSAPAYAGAIKRLREAAAGAPQPARGDTHHNDKTLK